MRITVLLLLSVCALSPFGEEVEAPVAPTAPAPIQAGLDPSPEYSPFGVDTPQLSISFKDVGLRLTPEHRAGVLEAIANGVAHTLASETAHRPAWTTPAWHRQCRRQHIYVDVWRSTHPDRLGYSLWRGCGAEDRVDHAEVMTRPRAFEMEDGLLRAGGLGETIGAAIGRCVAAARC